MTSTRTAKNKRFRLTKQQFCKCITLFCTFLCRHCTTTTWKYLISRLVEDLKTRQRLYFSFPELLYSLLEFNSPKKFANIWRIERNGIYKSDYVSNREPPFDFKFSDVFVAVAVFVINLPINRSKAWKFYLLFLFQNCWTLQGLEPAVVTSRLVTIFACYRCSVSTHLTDNAFNPRMYKGDVDATPPPMFFWVFFLYNQTSAAEFFSSCSFIPLAHFETSWMMIRYYIYEIWRHKYI